MPLLEHINIYFGTEFKSVPEFIKDMKQGDLSMDYGSDEEKLTHVLMFLNAVSRHN